jgi:hypothetical protein
MQSLSLVSLEMPHSQRRSPGRRLLRDVVLEAMRSILKKCVRTQPRPIPGSFSSVRVRLGSWPSENSLAVIVVRVCLLSSARIRRRRRFALVDDSAVRCRPDIHPPRGRGALDRGGARRRSRPRELPADRGARAGGGRAELARGPRRLPSQVRSVRAEDSAHSAHAGRPNLPGRR